MARESISTLFFLALWLSCTLTHSYMTHTNFSASYCCCCCAFVFFSCGNVFTAFLIVLRHRPIAHLFFEFLYQNLIIYFCFSRTKVSFCSFFIGKKAHHRTQKFLSAQSGKRQLSKWYTHNDKIRTFFGICSS